MNEEAQKISLSYEMTDELSVQATRDECLAHGRKHFKLTNILLMAACLAIFISAIERDGHWIWWIAIVPPANFIFLLVAWVITCWKAPREARRRLASLPHRTVNMEFSDDSFMIASAVMRSELSWVRLKSLERFKDYWLMCLEGGSKVPVPAGILTDQAVTLIRAKLAQQSA